MASFNWNITNSITYSKSSQLKKNQLSFYNCSDHFSGPLHSGFRISCISGHQTQVEPVLVSRSTSSCCVCCCVKSKLAVSKDWYSKLPSQLGPWVMGKTKRQPCVTTVQPFPVQSSSVFPAYQSSTVFHHSLTYLHSLKVTLILSLLIKEKSTLTGSCELSERWDRKRLGLFCSI